MELVPGLASFGRSGKNRPFWTGLNRPVQNPSIVQNCPKLSKTLIVFKEFTSVSKLNQYSTVLCNFQYLHTVEV